MAGAVTALLLALGLTAFAAPAEAAVYPKSIDTTCAFTRDAAEFKAGSRPIIRMRVSTSGNGVAKGTVVIKFHKRGSSAILRTTTRQYDGGLDTYTFKPFRRGRYVARAYFRTPADSVFQNCSDPSGFRVV